VQVGSRVRIPSLKNIEGRIVDFTDGYFVVEVDEIPGCKGCAEEIGKRLVCKEAQLQLIT
jgi:hypothetical protein